MPCERQARHRHNTIAFWLTDEEKRLVEARIILSDLPKGEYYRQSILGQRVHADGGRYHTARFIAELESLYRRATEQEDQEGLATLIQVLQELLREWRHEEDTI